MGGGSKKQTVGYRYFAGMHMVLCHGPIDNISRIRVDEKVLWEGVNSGGRFQAAATGSFTLNNNPVEGMGVVVGGTTFEFVNASPVGNQVQRGANKEASAANLAAKINALVSVNASSAGAKVNIVAAVVGDAGNAITLGLIGGTIGGFLSIFYISASGNRLSGGGGTINKRELFGGDSREGGISGDCDFLSGSATQTPNDYLVSRLGSLVPAFRGVASVVLRQMYLSMNPYLKTWSFRAQRIHIRDDGSPQWQDGLAQIDVTVFSETGESSIAAAMNPAHIIRECLTNRLWGMGYAEGDIDETSFVAAATTLYNEKMGMALLWDTQKSIEDFIKIVLQHIDAAIYVDRRTGKFVLKLVRGDYDESTLLVLDPSNIDKIDDFKRPTFGELCNSVTVNYWNYYKSATGSVTVQDIALAQEQGGDNNTTVTYEGFVDPATASKAAQRDLRSLSTPLITCTIYATKVARNLNIGSTFKLSWPDYQIEEVIMRVTGIAFGNGKTRRVRIQCAQDVFSYPEDAFVTKPPTGWIDPSGPPGPSLYQLAVELPYFELVRDNGQTQVDSQIATNPYVGYVGIAAAPPIIPALNGVAYTDDGSGYEEVGLLDFCAGAMLVADLDYTTDSFEIVGGQSLALVEANEWLQINGELMGVVSLVGTTLTVKRGILDTPPQQHDAGSVVMFWDGYAITDPTEYVASDMVNAKVTPANGSGVYPIDGATPLPVAIVGRAARPFPPANVLIDGSYRPAASIELPFAVTWLNRNRIVQTGGTLVGYFDGDITPEVGTTYNVRIYDIGMILVYSETTTGGSVSLTTAKIGTLPEAFIQIESERNGLTSMEVQTFYVTIKTGIPGDELFFVMDDLTSPPAGGSINFEMDE